MVCSLLVGKDFPEGRTRAVLQKPLGRTVWPQVQLGLLQAAFWFLLTEEQTWRVRAWRGGSSWHVPLVPSIDTIFGQSQLTNWAKQGGFGVEGQYSDIRQLFFLLGFNVLRLETGDKNCAPR